VIIKTIPSTWLIEAEHRLDCGPFVKGGVEARKTIENLRYPKNRLVDLTLDGINGMYHVGQDKIVWAENGAVGVPFLRSSDILKADLSNQPFISRDQVAENYLFQCPRGTTLITRSGTIGRMAYMRSDMEKMAISQDVLKVVPDQQRVKAGFLFAFLKSKYGIPIVTGGTFGSIIVHIEAENIADLPVPRLGDVEDQVHKLVEEAANLRVEATEQIKSAVVEFSLFSQGSERRYVPPRIGLVLASELQSRMDAAYHDTSASKIRKSILSGRHARIGDMCSGVFLPGIFKRIYAEDVRYGAYYHSAASVFSISPSPKAILSRKSNCFEEVLLSEGTVLIQGFGQEDGLIGRTAWVGKNLHGSATTHMFVRLNAHDERLAGYLFAFLSSEAGYALLTKLPYGGSIPHLNASQVADMPIPLLDDHLMDRVSALILKANKNRDHAIDLENEASAIVEHTIAGGAR
jgi:type I restriction enzyme S subunit